MTPPHEETLGEGGTLNIKRGWAEAFHGDELVVALPDLRVLQATLYEYGVRSEGRVDTNVILGLAHDGAPDLSELAQLIKGIQLLFADRYPGWQVTIGKNYRPAMVKGYPHLGGGEGEPTPTDEPFTRAVAGGPPRPDAGHGVKVGLADIRLYEHHRLAGHYFVGDGDGDHDLLPAGQHEYTEFDGHAAFVASCILQQAPQAEIHLRPVLDDRGDGSAWDAAVGLAELVPLGPDVLNLSFGEYMTDDSTAPMVLDAAVRRFSRDTVIVAAAGNNGNIPADGPRPAGVGPRTTSYPAGVVTGVIAARTEPDHRSAREAFDGLVQSLADQPQPGLLLNPARY
jgi:hypothetical protein